MESSGLEPYTLGPLFLFGNTPYLREKAFLQLNSSGSCRWESDTTEGCNPEAGASDDLQDIEGVELQTHMLLIQVLFLLTLVVTVELWAPDVLLIWVLKAFLNLVTGSWLMQIGFMLYRPISGYRWMDDDKNDIAFATTFFCWHVAFSAFLMLWIYGVSIL
ncbi:hypothetical protein STEG23_027966, partial [Scotinomys teguina]